ncbi:MAG: hypothetical protein IH621_15010 [Krumholzibacteria bacterium]|nr:hypothetical protein [Candidatus Krumholzibacteria bacterium]
MSSNDHNEWTDSLDFESLADEQEAHDIGGPTRQQDAVESVTELLEPVTEVEAFPELDDAPAPPEARTAPRPQRRARVSGSGLGVFFAVSILVAAGGLAAALVTALGIAPAALWRPEGLLSPERIIDFQANPLNLVYLVAAATALLALLGAWSVVRAVGKVSAGAARDARLVDKLAALRIDDEKGWQDPLFKQHPTAASFVNENVGAWRLQEARQRRAAGLEGELQRLLRAASTGQRDGLNDRFDNPAVGSLADELLRYRDEREAAVQEAAAIRAKDREEAERLMGLIVEANGWTTAATDKVGVQGAAVEQLAASLRRLADNAGARGQEEPVAQAVAGVAALRGKLSVLLRSPAPAGSAELEDLVDRSNKLAFQIAMEVARLGPRGERLLPMTQALEELTTEFRRAAEQVAGPVASPDAFGTVDQALARVQSALEQASAESESWRRTVRDAAPAAADAASQLAGLASGFNGQSTRLGRAGAACALMTGLEFNPAAAAPVDALGAPEPDLGFTRFDPFGAKAPAGPTAGGLEARLEADPFATGPAESPEQEDSLVDSFADSFADAFTGTTPGAPEAADPFVAADPEPVYDLSEFGAEPTGHEHAPAAALAETGRSAAAGTIGDDVLDLSAFGAVRLDEDLPAFAGLRTGGAVDTIHDLSEFGAVPLD